MYLPLHELWAKFFVWAFPWASTSSIASSRGLVVLAHTLEPLKRPVTRMKRPLPPLGQRDTI
jgi:hypothetical protein